MGHRLPDHGHGLRRRRRRSGGLAALAGRARRAARRQPAGLPHHGREPDLLRPAGLGPRPPRDLCRALAAGAAARRRRRSADRRGGGRRPDRGSRGPGHPRRIGGDGAAHRPGTAHSGRADRLHPPRRLRGPLPGDRPDGRPHPRFRTAVGLPRPQAGTGRGAAPHRRPRGAPPYRRGVPVRSDGRRSRRTADRARPRGRLALGRRRQGEHRPPAGARPGQGRPLCAGVVTRGVERGGLRVARADVNGAAGLLFADPASGQAAVLAFTVHDGRITEVDAVVNPDKLGHLDFDRL